MSLPRLNRMMAIALATAGFAAGGADADPPADEVTTRGKVFQHGRFLYSQVRLPGTNTLAAACGPPVALRLTAGVAPPERDAVGVACRVSPAVEASLLSARIVLHVPDSQVPVVGAADVAFNAQTVPVPPRVEFRPPAAPLPLAGPAVAQLAQRSMAAGGRDAIRLTPPASRAPARIRPDVLTVITHVDAVGVSLSTAPANASPRPAVAVSFDPKPVTAQSPPRIVASRSVHSLLPDIRPLALGSGLGATCVPSNSLSVATRVEPAREIQKGLTLPLIVACVPGLAAGRDWLRIGAGGKAALPPVSWPELKLSLAPAQRAPCIVSNRIASLPRLRALDEKIVENVLKEAEAGRLNRRNPELRKELIGFVADYPFTPEAYKLYAFMLENAAGNDARRKLETLARWGREYEGGRHAPILAYYEAYHQFRLLNYDAALGAISRYLERFPKDHDRLYLLRAMCCAQKNDSAGAFEALRKIESDHARSELVPEAVFLRAWISFQDGNAKEAAVVLRDLVSRYPASPSAARAKQVLDDLAERKP